MRIDRRLFDWGLFFILAGAIPLAIQLGLLTADTVGGRWRIWPLLIVGVVLLLGSIRPGLGTSQR